MSGVKCLKDTLVIATFKKGQNVPARTKSKWARLCYSKVATTPQCIGEPYYQHDITVL